MEHLSDDLLYTHTLEQATLTTQEAAHLTTCAECQHKLAHIQKLSLELQVARNGAPPSAVVTRAYEFFRHVQQQPSWLEQMVQRLQAQLVWDSRGRLAAQGLRRTATDGYHLLYATDRIEVELSVQPTAAGFDLTGELLPAEEDEMLAPALLHLQAEASGAVYETQSDAQGHFHLAGITQGRYTMLITPLTGALLAIDGLELV